MYLFSPYIFQVYKAVVNAGCTSPYSFSILRPKYSLKTMRFLLIAVIYSTYSTFCELDRFSNSLDCVFCGLIISVIGNWIGSNGILGRAVFSDNFFYIFISIHSMFLVDPCYLLWSVMWRIVKNGDPQIRIFRVKIRVYGYGSLFSYVIWV